MYRLVVCHIVVGLCELVQVSAVAIALARASSLTNVLISG
jgi:hypothetical protein